MSFLGDGTDPYARTSDGLFVPRSSAAADGHFARGLQRYVEDQWPKLGVKVHLSWTDNRTTLTVRLVLSGGRKTRLEIPAKDLYDTDNAGAVQRILQEIAVALEPAAAADTTWDPVEKPTMTDYIVGFREWALKEEEVMIAPVGADALLDPEMSIEEWFQQMPMTTGEGGSRAMRYALAPLTGRNNPWRGNQEVEARCHNERHPAPHPGSSCHCGFNAYHTIDRTQTSRYQTARVWGAVRARGRIEVSADGFRSQFSQPIALGYRDDQAEFVKRVGKALGIMAIPLAGLEAYCSEHGVIVPEDQRPPGPTFRYRR